MTALRFTHDHPEKGLSLIELMVAMLIGSILLLGVFQIFAASRSAYQISEGLSRTQENGRFAMDYLQKDIRMVGHFGCVNDQARLQATNGLISHLTQPGLDFGHSIQGYDATGTAPGDNVNLSSPPSGWTPALPTYISSLNPLAGSDIVVLRFLAGDGLPVTGISSSELTVSASNWDTLTKGGVADPTMFGLADCTRADVFEASTAPSTGKVTAANEVGALFSLYTASPAGPAMLYRADALVYYVATGTGGGPSLFRARVTPTGNIVEELVEGVENMQFLYGQDSGDVRALTGNITMQRAASALDTTETNWRRVGQVQVGLLMRSPDNSAAGNRNNSSALPLRVLGVEFSPPSGDGRYRTSYEATIALRNRLYGN